MIMKKRIWITALALAAGSFAATGFCETTVYAAEDQAQKISKVTMSKESGCYDEAFSLKLTCEGADKIYYTTDGSDPTVSKTRKEYGSRVSVTDRKQDQNVVSAVDPALFDCAYATYKNGKIGDQYSAPKDSEVDKATLIKAAGLLSDGTYTAVASNTYFVGKMTEHIQGIEESCKNAGVPLSIMSVSMEYSDLFDYEKGIYVKGKVFDDALGVYKKEHGADATYDPLNSRNVVDVTRKLEANYTQRGSAWERAAHIDYLESDGVTTKCKLQQDCGIRMQGNYSRSDYQKGFRLYAKKEYGDKNFKYAFFGEDLKDDAGKTKDKFKKLVLRNGGNGAFLAKYNDAYWQSLITDLSCDTQAARVCVVYLNGEYWGLYILEEDYDDSYFENTHGVNKDDVVVYKGDAEKYESGYKLDEGTLPSGVTDEGYYLQELMLFFETHSDLKKESDYQEFAKLVDTDSFLDYFAVQIWINNKWDWPGKNWSMWKTAQTDGANTYADGRWRLSFYDLDFGGVSGASDVSTNTIRDDNYNDYGLLDMDTKNPVVLSYAYLMSNPSFRKEFSDKLKELSSKNFETEAAINALQKYRDVYQPLYQQFFTRYFGEDNAAKFTKDAVYGGYGSYSCIQGFLKRRSKYIQKMLDWVETFYSTHTVYNSALPPENDPDSDLTEKKTISKLAVTAVKGKKVITVKTVKKAKVTVTLSSKLIKNGKKTVKKLTIASGKNKNGTVKISLSKKLTRGIKISVKVSKNGYATKTKTIKVK